MAAQVSPSPCNNWNMPSGRPAPAMASAINWPDIGAHSDGLNTTGHPAASALASLWQAMPDGAFHGAATAAGPSGNRSTMKPASRRIAGSSRASFAAERNAAGQTRAIDLVRVMGTPVIRASVCAMTSTIASRAIVIPVSTSARRSLRMLRQTPPRWAASALRIARLTCAGVEPICRNSGSPVFASRTVCGNKAPGSRHSPAT